MKSLLFLICLVNSCMMFSVRAEAEQEEWSPDNREPLSRYMRHFVPSPFGSKKLIMQPAEDTSSFADVFTLVGSHSIDGEVTIALKRNETGEIVRLKEGQTTDDGIRLVDLELDRDRANSFARIGKGNELAVIKFAEVSVSAEVSSEPGGEKVADPDSRRKKVVPLRRNLPADVESPTTRSSSEGRRFRRVSISSVSAAVGSSASEPVSEPDLQQDDSVEEPTSLISTSPRTRRVQL